MPMDDAVPGYKARINVDGINLSHYSTSVSVEGASEQYEFQRLTDKSLQTVPVGSSFAVAHNGFYTGNIAGLLEEVFSSRIKSGAPCVVAVTFDKVAYILEDSWASQMTITAPVSEVITIEGRWSGARKVSRGLGGGHPDVAVPVTGPINPALAVPVDAEPGMAYIAVGARIGGAGPVKVDLMGGADATTPTVVGSITAPVPGIYSIPLPGHLAFYRLNPTDLGGATGVPISYYIT